MRREFFRLRPCSCGHVDERSWPYSPPTQTCKQCGSSVEVESFTEDFRAYVPSTSMKRFQPHFNTSLGMKIESIEHFEKMKAKHGAFECELKPGAKCDGGVPDSVPRDWFSQMKHAHDVLDKVNSDPGIAQEKLLDEAEFSNDPITEIDMSEATA